jgi:nucleotide-binding universal stress UspA family protein
MEPLTDEARLTADIEQIWQSLAAGRVEAERERVEARERGADLAAIGESLRGFSSRHRQRLAEHRREREERLGRQ